MPPILSPPPGHPSTVAFGGRGQWLGLEAELRRGFGDAVDEGVLVLVIAVLAHEKTCATPERSAGREPRPRDVYSRAVPH